MTQLQWSGLVMWPYKTNRNQQTKQVMCPEGKKLKMFSEHQNDYISSNLVIFAYNLHFVSNSDFKYCICSTSMCRYVCMHVCECTWICVHPHVYGCVSRSVLFKSIFEDHTAFPGCCPLLPDWDLPGYTGLMACLRASVSFTKPSACLASYALEFYISLLQVFWTLTS